MTLHAITQKFYTMYANYLARRLVKKLLKIDVTKRREYLLSKNFNMVGYSKNGNEETRIYLHKSGLKITDTYSKKVAQ